MHDTASAAPAGVTFVLPSDVAHLVADDVFRAHLPAVLSGRDLARLFGDPGHPANYERVRRRLRKLGFHGAPGRRLAIPRDELLRRIADAAQELQR